jgi:AraC family transcriptional regulator of adaptative response/methylated-DNA-[protein]-cysteine methyltransferase
VNQGMSSIEMHKHYKKISKAIEYLNQNRALQPDLSSLASYVGISEFHLQRLFTNWVGISPKQFLMYLTQDYAKSQLEKSSVLNSALNSGLSSASRLHDLMIQFDGVTPGEFKKKGRGLDICYGIHETPFSYCLLATTKRGVCKLAFFDDSCQSELYIQELKSDWPNAIVTAEQALTKEVIDRIFPKTKQVKSDPSLSDDQASLHLCLKGTPFQLKVWQALLSIPDGSLCSYQQIADSIGASSSVRAVASAVAKNNIAYLIPCHRVIKSTGAFNKYRWGVLRKKVMILKEAALLTSHI